MANDDALRSWHFLQLRRSIEALASDASEQLLLFPGDTTSVSHLAFTFEHWADMMRTHYDAELSATQHDALRMIAGQLALMSRDGTEFDPVLWTDEARRAHPHWETVRALAGRAREAFDWQEAAPGTAAGDEQVMTS